MDDEAQFREFVRVHGTRLHRLAAPICGAHAAQDAVQAGLEKAFASWSRVRAAEDPGAYVRRIVVREAVREARRSDRQSRWHAGADRAGAPDPAEDRIDLAALLQTLTPKQRAVVVLRYLEDRPVAEVARALGVAEGTVKRQAFDAVRSLRLALSPHGSDAVSASDTVAAPTPGGHRE